MTILTDSANAIGFRFPDESFTLTHRLAGHELFEVERLLELARSLSEDSVE